MIALLLLSIAQDEAYTEKLPGSTVEFKMVPVPGGSVTIGGKEVKVEPFFIGATEVTWEMFDQFTLSGDPSDPGNREAFAPDAIARPSAPYILPDLGWGHKGYPVINVSSLSAEMFCRWVSSVTGKKYRLPTEAEWELACRGGVSGDWALAEEMVAKSAWYEANSVGTTSPVARKAPNAYGLYDMLGNVGEWAYDVSGKPVLCGGIFTEAVEKQSPLMRRYYSPEWQVTDPQFPKSRWWLSDGWFVGLRLVREE